MCWLEFVLKKGLNIKSTITQIRHEWDIRGNPDNFYLYQHTKIAEKFCVHILESSKMRFHIFMKNSLDIDFKPRSEPNLSEYILRIPAVKQL